VHSARSGLRRTGWTAVLLLLLIGGSLLLRGHEGPLPVRAVPPAPSPSLVAVSGPFGSQVSAAAWTPDGSVLGAGRDFVARLWNAHGREVATFRGHRGPVLDARMAPNGASVATASVDGTVRLWKPDGTPLEVLAMHRGAVQAVRFDATGRRLLSVGLDGEVWLSALDGRDGVWLDDGESATVEAHFVGERILTRDARGFVRRYHLDGTPVSDPEGEGAVAALRVAPGLALCLRTDGSVWVVRVLDADSDAGFLLQGHEAAVLDADAAPGDERIATASLDGTARLWTGREQTAKVLEGHGLAVVRVRLDQGAGALTLAADGVLRLWSPSGALVNKVEGPPLRDAGYLASDPPLVWGLPKDAAGVCLWSTEGAALGCFAASGGRILDALPSPRGDALLLRTADLGLRVLRFGTVSADSEERMAEPEEGRRATAARGDYLGAAGCAGCHRQECDLWAASNHARSLEPATARNVPDVVRAEGLAEHPPGQTSFGETKDGTYVARTTGVDGEEHDFPLGWIAGRARIRMYVTSMEDGRLQVLPCMRSELTDSWFDYTHLLFSPSDTLAAPTVEPGDDAFWTGQGRSWGSRCAHCHSSGAEPRGPQTPGPRAVFRDLGVDCEACHGPGRAHAEAWSRMQTDRPLPKLGALPRDASVQACTRCHMEGERLKAAPVPGEDFYEFLDPTLLLDPDRVDPRGRPLELIYHGLPFGVSRCANEGKLTCVRCHASHGGAQPALLGREPTNDELCAECHVELVRDVTGHSHHRASGSGARCVGCHMPRLVIERGHGIVTDHSISVPDPEAEGDRVAQDACSWCHQFGLGSPPDVPILDRGALRATYRQWWPEAKRSQPWMTALEQGRMRTAGATDALRRVAEDATQYRLVRASATRLLGRQGTPAATSALTGLAHDEDMLVRRSALTALAGVRDPQVDALFQTALADPSSSVRSAAARAALEGWERVRENPALLRRVLPVLEAEVGALPNDEMRWFRLGAARDVSGDAAGAMEAYEAMLALHPLARSVRERLAALRAGAR